MHALTTLCSRSRYSSLMYEARRRLHSEATTETVPAATDSELEIDVDVDVDVDVEATLAETEGIAMPPVEHHSREPAERSNGAPPQQTQSSHQTQSHARAMIKDSSTSTPSGVVKNQHHKPRRERSFTPKKEQQRSITGWFARNN